jgi:hypothetical protein
MTWKCPDCGFENDDGKRACEGGCGYAKVGRLILESATTGKRVPVAINTDFTKQLLLAFAGEDAKYASAPQFSVSKRPGEGWFIEHASGAKNPTFLNGAELSSRVQVADGDVVSIGPEKMKVRLKLET